MVPILRVDKSTWWLPFRKFKSRGIGPKRTPNYPGRFLLLRRTQGWHQMRSDTSRLLDKICPRWTYQDSKSEKRGRVDVTLHRPIGSCRHSGTLRGQWECHQGRSRTLPRLQTEDGVSDYPQCEQAIWQSSDVYGWAYDPVDSQSWQNFGGPTWIRGQGPITFRTLLEILGSGSCRRAIQQIPCTLIFEDHTISGSHRSSLQWQAGQLRPNGFWVGSKGRQVQADVEKRCVSWQGCCWPWCDWNSTWWVSPHQGFETNFQSMVRGGCIGNGDWSLGYHRVYLLTSKTYSSTTCATSTGWCWCSSSGKLQRWQQWRGGRHQGERGYTNHFSTSCSTPRRVTIESSSTFDISFYISRWGIRKYGYWCQCNEAAWGVWWPKPGQDASNWGSTNHGTSK